MFYKWQVALETCVIVKPSGNVTVVKLFASAEQVCELDGCQDGYSVFIQE